MLLIGTPRVAESPVLCRSPDIGIDEEEELAVGETRKPDL